MNGRWAILAMLALAACSRGAPPPDAKAIEAAAHDGYVAAINSNDVARLMAVVTDDIVYQAPHQPEIVGKAAVRQWATGYMQTYRTRWEKSAIGFTVAGDWAFERYTYRVTDTDRKTGAATFDRGKGINIFHRDADGKWRVAVDGWSSDIPPVGGAG